MKNPADFFWDKVIIISFYALFFLVPLILTPFNYELFEYNKMMITYAFTTVIVGSWIIKCFSEKEIKFARSPLDIPLVLFLISQIVSTLFSIDHHVSVWGYYSRFNGGLLSTICYILLYFAFTSNFPRSKIIKLLSFALTSGLIVSFYGILEHLGIDKNLWVQDVQNRVFSTLGQPNWLAAYLAVLTPITVGIGLNSFSTPNTFSEGKIQFSKFKIQSEKKENYNGLFACCLPAKALATAGVIGLIFYLTLLFTKSRSGFIGFWTANSIFWVILFIKYRVQYFKIFIILNSLFIILTFIFGTPFQQLNRFTSIRQLPDLSVNTQPAKPTGDSIIDVGITESGKIRNIVWKGAIDIFKYNPLFGTGVETFAFSYYKYRPPEHNLTSEWDFLYNKAHNEYLNFAANSGIFGLGSYLLIIVIFIIWCIRYQVSGIWCQKDNSILNTKYLILNTSLLSAWLSILITNFFGFSVVIIQLFFFLIPAISFLLSDNLSFVYLFHPKIKPPMNQKSNETASGTVKQFNNLPAGKADLTINNYQLAIIIFIILAICYLLYSIFRLWYADTIFSSGYHFSRSKNYLEAYQSIKKAIMINRSEPFYYDELAVPASILAVSFKEENQATLASQLQEEATLSSDMALSISPNNINFWKTRTRVFYALSVINEKYLQEAVESLEIARTLCPTDPKILYNLAVMYGKFGKKGEAIAFLQEAVSLKPDYRDAYLALALFWEGDNDIKKAKETLNLILTRINPDDQEVKKKLEEMK